MIARTRIFLFADLLAAATCGHAFPALAQIVALGASNIAGRGVGSSEVFPAQLERMLAAKGYNVYVANAGVNGDTNSGMLARLDQAVPDATRIVLLGTRGGSFNARRLGQGDQKGEFASIVTRLRSRALRSSWSRAAASDENICNRTAFICPPRGTPFLQSKCFPL
jgi:acyl-CoA thioesterase-1